MISPRILLASVFAFGCAFTQAEVSPGTGVQVTQLDDRVKVEVGGSLFTEYHFKNVFNPYCYPMLGPGGAAMTRNWPLKNVPGEEHDHPHHRSFWYSHGDVNGVNFWSEETNSGKIVHQAFLKLESGPQSGVIVTTNNWIGTNGQLVCSDTRTMRIYSSSGADRMFDFDVTIYAPADKPVVFADTKEGTMAMRLAETMRLKQPGNKPGHGHIVMSSGTRDMAAWGTNAKWVEYYGPVDGKTVGVAIFDHPANPRHPTTWHARDYGLVAANPFGLHDFQKKPKGAGDMTVPAGKTVTFRYRFYLHEGNAEAKLPALFEEYSKQ